MKASLLGVGPSGPWLLACLLACLYECGLGARGAWRPAPRGHVAARKPCSDGDPPPSKSLAHTPFGRCQQTRLVGSCTDASERPPPRRRSGVPRPPRRRACFLVARSPSLPSPSSTGCPVCQAAGRRAGQARGRRARRGGAGAEARAAGKSARTLVAFAPLSSRALSAALLELNPEVYTAWNLRHDALELALLEATPQAATALLGAPARPSHALPCARPPLTRRLQTRSWR